MQKLPTLALAAIGAAALAGAAVAADQTKTMRVPLADGSTVVVEYVGDVAPKVTVTPAPAHQFSIAFPDLAGVDRIFTDMRRRHAELMRRVEALSRQPLGAGSTGLNLASAGNMPEGSTSVSVVTVSNGGKACTRTTEVVSQGAGKAPKVTTRSSGDCGPQAIGSAGTGALNHT